MPARETLPFIQCHHTSGRAAGGGWRNVARRASSAQEIPAHAQTAPSAIFLKKFAWNVMPQL